METQWSTEEEYSEGEILEDLLESLFADLLVLREDIPPEGLRELEASIRSLLQLKILASTTTLSSTVEVKQIPLTNNSISR